MPTEAIDSAAEIPYAMPESLVMVSREPFVPTEKDERAAPSQGLASQPHRNPSYRTSALLIKE